MKIRLLTSIASSAMLASLATAQITATWTAGANLSTTVNTQSISGVSVSDGDMIVFAAATNKKTSVTTMAFTVDITSTGTTGTLTNLSAGGLSTESNPNPDSYLSYAMVTGTGLLDVTITDTAGAGSTTNWGVYVVSGSNLAVAGQGANYYASTDVAIGASTDILTNAYALDDTYSEAWIVEVLGGTKINIAPNDPNNLIGYAVDDTPTYPEWDAAPSGATYPGRRLIGDAVVSGSIASISNSYDIVLQPTKTGNITGSVIGLAIVSVPEPSTIALLSGFAALGLVLYRRRRR